MHKMRRSQSEVKDRTDIDIIIQACDVIRIGMSVDNKPYIVPLNFGYLDNAFYFHGSQQGRKMDMIKANPNVCFELDTNHKLVSDSERACDWTMKYSSVMGDGKMTIIHDPKEKIQALNILMRDYGGNDEYEYSDEMIERIGIMKLEIKNISGKEVS